MLCVNIIYIVIALFGLAFGGNVLTQPLWDTCPDFCMCKWISGKKTADCKNKELHFIPDTLSTEIQMIDLSGNQIERLPNGAFESVNLTSLSKINLQNSQIKEIDIQAFRGLKILVELDLSENRIHAIYPGTFKDSDNLRILSLNKNPLQKIQANLFTSQHLTKLDLADCSISEIEDGTFSIAKNLFELRIDRNKFSNVNITTFNQLTKLRSFYFYDNPWNCDCHLRELRNWVIEKHLLTEKTICVQPKKLEHRGWADILPEEFSCKPQIIWPPPGKIVVPENQEVNLACHATGDPLPRVQWFHNSMVISDDNTVKYNANRYIINTSTFNNDLSKWVNLTVQNVNSDDKGLFRCVVENPGGVTERNITLLLNGGGGGGVVEVAGYDIESWPLIIGLATGLTALVIIICIIVCCFCCRYRQGKSSKLSVASDKQDESLLSYPNPIQKPPRSNDTGLSTDDGIELSELNTKLLDEHSLQGTICTSERSVECLDSIPEACPPDLIAFRRFPVDPLRTPGVHSLHRYGTLPYSRSHSPLTPLVLPRQGYVTIPRRPRVPSWSSAPTPSLLDDPLLLEPVYDNLGPRTTADGSSALSLNKSLPEHPRKKKPFPPYYFHFESPCPSPLAANDKDNKKEEFMKPPLAKSPLLDGEITPVKKIAPKPPPKPKKGGPLFEDEGEDGTEV